MVYERDTREHINYNIDELICATAVIWIVRYVLHKLREMINAMTRTTSDI